MTGSADEALPGMPAPAEFPPLPPTCLGALQPMPAPPGGWAAVQWIERGGDHPGRRWRRRSETHAITLDSTAAERTAVLDEKVVNGFASVIEVASLPALVREVLALRAAAVYHLGYHEEGDECDDVDAKTGMCPHVEAYVATVQDARVRYRLAELLDFHTPEGVEQDPAAELEELRDLAASLKRALAGDYGDD